MEKAPRDRAVRESPTAPGVALTLPPGLRFLELQGPERDRALPILKESFSGYYRWHAKRTLREIATVRALEQSEVLVGVTLLARLTPVVGYVYYLFVGEAHRRRGFGARLLDDALAQFAAGGARVAYAAVEEENLPSLALFQSRGFREVERREKGWAEGGLGAWGLRSQMTIVSGELLYGRRLDGPVVGLESPREPPRGAADDPYD
ncbi:MAG: GNAT family N-acetyltransferase [Thermoplasmata archaeon]|nr:GNAT family N-acetyltransferase [Thermoplasmata archaeon]